LRIQTKKTLVLGASTKESRYSNMCIRELSERNFPVEALGLREGMIGEVPVQTGKPLMENIDTVSLYLGANNQQAFYQYILDLKPRRVIFNPGTDNPEFEELLEKSGIEVTAACSLVMLHAGIFFDASES
jgi:uncharacterized protein